jgi:hypothetical protein
VDEVMHFGEQPRKWKLNFDQRLLLWGSRRRHGTGDHCFRKCSIGNLSRGVMVETTKMHQSGATDATVLTAANNKGHQE